MPPMRHPTFDPLVVPLSNSNLIEASAGTGKTYSIAIMALRLIVERDIRIQEILMVTFTKAAVAELELRVRAFIRLALKVCRGEAIDDPQLATLINGYLTDSAHKEYTQERLQRAQVFLDETSVLTIHSFCQKILSEYAFETGQIFSPETLTPETFNEMVEDNFHEFWRQYITTLPEIMLNNLLGEKLNRKNILDIVKNGLSGKQPFSEQPLPPQFLTEVWVRNATRSFEEKQAEIERLRDEAITFIRPLKDSLLVYVQSKSNPKKFFAAAIENEDWDALIDAVAGKAGLSYMKDILAQIEPVCVAVANAKKQLYNDYKSINIFISIAAYEFVKNALSAKKVQSGAITFDDMIHSLFNAIKEGPERFRLRDEMRTKYKAVFIDEFQDTDREQYEIFHFFFDANHTIFYIGDPKQSIYAWRKADIFTYFEAAENVDHVHLMNTNHRSTADLIESMNAFFLPKTDFDTFYFSGETSEIKYQRVRSPAPNTKGSFWHNDTKAIPIQISRHKRKADIKFGTYKLVSALLHSGNYFVEKKGEKVPVKPSDIGILVRSNYEGRLIKEVLSKKGIPAITIDDTKLFSCTEALELYYVLCAVYEVTRATINRALLTSIGGYDRDRLLNANEDHILQQFRTYRETWKSKGVYVMLRQFLSDHELESLFYDPNIENPERTVANILQLVELIHKNATRKNYDERELLQWLKKGIDGDTRDGDEYVQRIESDEEAVKIVTIHKSKGLEYNIVIAPFLDMKKTGGKFTSVSFMRGQGEYYVAEKEFISSADSALATKQREQENRRLLYVAITRARYACFIQQNTYTEKSSSLGAFLLELKQSIEAGSPHFCYQDTDELDFYPTPGAGSTPATRVYAKPGNAPVLEQRWRKTSYSNIRAEHGPLPSIRYQGNAANAYDVFVFRDLKKGALIGTQLHYLFESINFADDTKWSDVVERVLNKTTSKTTPEYIANLVELLHEITGTTLLPNDSFTLSQLQWNKRLNELEFDFPLGLFDTDALMALSTPEHPFFLKPGETIEGIMNGLMDLFFEYNGKYYILDWKSNYLGDTVDDYNEEKLAEAMIANNYHLQYHIYTVALCKYLRLRLPNFNYDTHFGGVLYLFLRGVRKGKRTGIYFNKPSADQIAKIEQLLIHENQEEFL